MRINSDKIRNKILEVLKKADEPLETREIELILKNVTRVKVLYRLNNLRGDGLIKGKPVGSGKGAWIWWRKDAF
jgi:repressor of nif and glnA expression